MPEQIGDVELRVGLNDQDLDGQIAQVTSRLEQIQDRQVRVNADLSNVDSQIAATQRNLQSLNNRKIAITAESTQIDAQVAQLQVKLARLQSPEIRLKLGSAEADRQIAAIRDRLSQLQNRRIELRADTANINQQVAQVRQRLSELRDRRVQLSADKAKLDSDLAGAKQSLDQLRDVKVNIDTRGVGSQLRRLATNFAQGIAQGIGQQLTSQVSALAGQGVRQLDIIGPGVDANFATARISTLTDQSDQVSVALRGLSADLGNVVDATSLVTASYDVLSARTSSLQGNLSDAAVATNILEAATKGAIGGFSDTNTVANALTSTMNAYKISAEDAEAVVDQFAATQNAGKITIDQYAQQIGRVAPLAAQAGVSLEELNGFIATATVEGVQVEQAFAGVRAALAATINPSQQATKLANELGISFDAQALRTKGLSGILAELNAIGADTPEVLTVLFGRIEAVGAIAPATGAGLQNLNRNIQSIGDSAGTINESFEKVRNTFQFQAQSFSNAFENTKGDIAEALFPAAEGIIELFQDAFSQIGDSSEFLQILNNNAKEFQQVLQDNPEIAERLAEALNDAASAFGDAAIEGIKTLSETLKNNPEIIQQTIAEWGDFLKAIGEAVTGVIKITTELAKLGSFKVPPVVGELAELATKNPVQGIADQLTGTFNFGRDAVQDIALQGPERASRANIRNELRSFVDDLDARVKVVPEVDKSKPAKVEIETEEKRKIDVTAAVNRARGQKDPAVAEAEKQKKELETRRRDALKQIETELAQANQEIDLRVAQQSLSIEQDTGRGTRDSRNEIELVQRRAVSDRIAAREREASRIDELAQQNLLTEQDAANRKQKIELDITNLKRQELEKQTSDAKKAQDEQTKKAQAEAEKRRKAAVDAFDQGFAQQNQQLTQSTDTAILNARSSQLDGGGPAQGRISQIERRATAERIRLKQQEQRAISGLVAQGLIDETEAAQRRSRLESEVTRAKQAQYEQQKREFLAANQAQVDAAKRASQTRIAELDRESAAINEVLQQLEAESRLIDARNNLSSARASSLQGQADRQVVQATEAVDVAVRLQTGDTGPELRRVLEAQARELGVASGGQIEAIQAQVAAQEQADQQRLANLELQQRAEQAGLELDIRRQAIAAQQNQLESERAVLLARQNAVEAQGALIRAQRLGNENEIANAQQQVALANQGVEIANRQVDAANRNIQAQEKLVGISRQALDVKQESERADLRAANAANSRERERRLATARDEQGSTAAGSGNFGGTSGGATAGGDATKNTGAFNLSGSDITAFREATEIFERVARSTDQQSAFVSELRLASDRTREFLLARADTRGLGQGAELFQRLQAEGSNGLRAAGLDVLNQRFAQLAASIDGLANSPRSLTLNTADPVSDLTQASQQRTGNLLRSF